MVNRELIRLKTVQIVYSYYLNGRDELGAQGVNASEKELTVSLDKAYELYLSLLALLVEIKRVAVEDVEHKQMRNKQLGITEPVNTRFANNRLLQMLCQNEQLLEFREKNNQIWIEDDAVIESMYNGFIQSSDYEAYLNEEDSFKADQTAVRNFYRLMVCNNDELHDTLEDKCIYWNDDKFIIDTFVLKTIKLFKEDSTKDMVLLPQYNSNEELEYAVKLLRHAIENDKYYRSLIESNSKGWDMKRIALMDKVIIQIGLAEIISFPNIPVAVSINEYVNIAKMYSAGRNSSAYINATLDVIAKQLQSEHKIIDKI